MTEARRLRLEAPAKINLYLEVVGRRKDGFHELTTVLQTLDLADQIELSIRPRDKQLRPSSADIRFELQALDQPDADGPSPTSAVVPGDEHNIAVQAADRWLHAAGLVDAVGIDLKLEKKIPAGAGLGGGSSDAASVLLGLDQLMGQQLGAEGQRPALQPLAAALGSDVPFFLVGGTALCLGRGELVQPLAEPAPFDVFLGFPGFPVPTPSVYGALSAAPLLEADDSRRRSALIDAWQERLADATPADLDALYRNDLEAPSQHIRSELVDLLALPGVHLSGSGSTLFLYGSEPPSDALACRRTSMRFVRHRSRKR